jgi:hypothetical protein
MADLKNTFIQGVMNKDLDERLVPQGQYRDAQNITVETSEGSNVGAAQNALGNTLSANIATVSGRQVMNARTIGSVAYEAAGLLYWFVASDYFDGIYEYDETTGTTVRVLQSNKANPNTPSKLNFRHDYLITGVNHIIGPDGNTFLYWTDNYNPPRRVNIKRVKSSTNGIGGYAIDDDRIDIDIDVILEPPMYAPHIEPFSDGSEANNMSEKFLYFAYRYLYVDDQYSSLSPFSGVAFKPDEYNFDYGVGNNKSMTNIYNACKVSFETGNEFVKAVQLVVRDTRSLNVGIVDTYDKDELNALSQISNSATVVFNNNKVLAALPTDQVTRLFDNVPLLAKAQDVIGNRLSYGNYVQFRDIEDCNGDDIDINFSLEVKQPPLEPTTSNPLSTWRSDRDLEFALLYSDDYGRLTTALTCDTNSIYIPPANSTTANQLVLTIRHQAPCWATHYRIAVKQGKSKVYNVFPILYYASGSYRYFLINESDVDKVKVGEYLIFKSDTDGATESNKKYKILEIDSKSANFLGGSQISGVYIKIKVDTISEFPISGITTFSLESTGYGAGANAQFPVLSTFGFVEQPIHYGSGDPQGLIITSQTPISNTSDVRFTIEIVDQSTFKYTSDIDAAGGWTSVSLVQGATNVLSKFGFDICSIQFTQSQYTIGDRWKVNVRSGGNLLGNYFGGVGIPNGSSTWNPGDYGGAIIANKGFTDPILAGAVITMELLEDSLNPSELAPAQQFPPSPSNFENIEEWFIESGAYLEYDQYNKDGVNIKSQGITFRRGSAFVQNTSYTNPQDQIIQGAANQPMYMIVQGFGFQGQDINTVRFKLSVVQSNDLLLCETAPKDTDAEIFHELSQTYPIDGSGNHLVKWQYEDFQYYADANGTYTKLVLLDKSRPHYFTVGDVITVESDDDINFPSGDYTVLYTPDRYTVVLDTPWVGSGPTTGGYIKLSGSLNEDQASGVFTPAIIELNTPANPNCDYNAWTWGNGLESDRIYDDFNETTIEYSPRATTVIDNYKQIRNDASICYSGIYNENTQYNRLNEFNLSLANFKYLDREFGSIQKLHARDTDLTVFQEKKVSRVLYGKNVLFDSAGGGQVASIPEVLGTQIPKPYEYGISRAPESFATWGDLIWFADPRNGVVIQMEGDTMVEVSSLGMKDYFRDLMRDNPFTQKLGAYDPYNHMYFISNNSERSIPCNLSISREVLKVPKDAAGYLFFSIESDTSWTISLVNTGDGTNWVNGFQAIGNGSQNIFGNVSQNLTASNRSVNFVVTYCDGQTETFTLSQAKGRKGVLVTLVYSNQIVRQDR